MDNGINKKSKKTCVCKKERHKSRGAAESQLRALRKLQDLESGKKDFKDVSKLHVYRSTVCEKGLRDGKEVWHVGHR